MSAASSITGWWRTAGQPTGQPDISRGVVTSSSFRRMVAGGLPLPSLVQAVLLTLAYTSTSSIAWFFVMELLLQAALLLGCYYLYWDYSRSVRLSLSL